MDSPSGGFGLSHDALRFAAGKWNADKEQWDNHANDAFTDGGPEPIGWMELPELELERKSFNEWLKTKEYEGIIVLDDYGWQFALMTKHEFEQKLLTSRVQISQDKLKELLKK